MTAEQLRKSILQLAIQGKLVKQNPQDEPASVLLERIRKEKESLIKEGKIKRDKQDSIIFKGDDNCYYEKIGKTIENIDEEISDFSLSEGWVFARIGNLLNIQTGATFKKEQTSSNKSHIRILRGGNIVANNYSFYDNDLFIAHDLINDNILLRKNDIITPSVTSIENIGKVAIIDKDYANVTAGGFVFILRSYYKDEILARYIYFALQSVYLTNLMKSITKKSGQAFYNLGKSRLSEIIIPIPPFEEQSRIVERLEKLEPLIEKYDALEKQATKLDNEIKDKLRKSILQYAIQGKLVPQDKNDEPASMLLECICKEKKAQLGKKYVESYIYRGDDNCYYEKIGNAIENITDSIPFDIPNSWEWAKVDSILHVNPRSKISDETEASFVAMKSIKEGFCNDFVFESKYWKNIKKGFTHFKDKDVGFAKITPCFQNRKSVIFRNLRNGVGAGTTEIHILRSIGGTVSSEYLLWFVKTPYFINHGISKFAGTAGQQRFATVDLKNMAIPLPPYPEQIRMIKRINSLFGILN